MRILGIDPGKTTGMSLVSYGQIPEMAEVIAEKEVKNLSGIWVNLIAFKPTILVVEDYILGKLPSNAKPPIKVIGICELFAELHNIRFITSNPSILQGAGKKPKGLSPHIWSARSHAMHYVKTRC